MNFIKFVFIFVIAFVSKSQGQDDLAGTFLSGNYFFSFYYKRESMHSLFDVLHFLTQIFPIANACQRIYE